jgi:hypothetical protein
MALLTTKRRFELGRSCVLAPERYDPRRDTLRFGSTLDRVVPLGDIVRIVRQTINPARSAPETHRFVVLDTSDIREGLIVGRKTSVSLVEIGSTKKCLQTNDVLISRLRPYLRQVALVDQGFADQTADASLACSTEFFVLRSLDEESIAFLVPFLLSTPVQGVLAAAQEGGHHPRFNEDVLMELPVPESLRARRKDVSAAILRCAALYRQSEQALMGLIAGADVAVVSSALAAESPGTVS